MKSLQSNSKIVIHNPPSIPYKDSAFGYEPLDQDCRLLINVGNTFKKNYHSQINQSPGPGAYEIAQSYLKNAKVLNYNQDTSKRSEITGSNKVNSRLGPGTYNVLTTDRSSKSQVNCQSQYLSQRNLPLIHNLNKVAYNP